MFNKQSKIGSLFQDQTIWRWITNFWTAVYFAFTALNFLAEGKYDYLNSTVSIIYIGVLGIYVSTKEFDRWYEKHESRHPGEWFVIFWTAVIVLMMVLSFSSGHSVPSETIATYIGILSIFAITQKSKKLYEEKRKKG